MANTSRKYPFRPMSVTIDGSSVLVEQVILVDEVPIGAMPLMQIGTDPAEGAEMFAALPVDRLPLPPEFPVYVQMGDEAYLMPIDFALRRGQWEDHPDGFTQEEIDDLATRKG